MVSQSRRAELRRGSMHARRLLRQAAMAWRKDSCGSGEVVSQSRRAEILPRLNTIWASTTPMAKAWRRMRWKR